MKTGKLYLIPTPIAPDLPLEACALELLKTAVEEHLETSVFLIEEAKMGRRRWVRFGLSREVIPRLVLYNEQNSRESVPLLIKELQSGKNLFLMSDGGLPAFCDPGRSLVEQCHRQGIEVTSTPFPHSVSLAVALSGFPSEEYFFRGFLPQKKDLREQAWLEIIKEKRMIVLMDTPYRLRKVILELKEVLFGAGQNKRMVFLARNLNDAEQKLHWGRIEDLLPLELEKENFVLLLAPLDYRV